MVAVAVDSYFDHTVAAVVDIDYSHNCCSDRTAAAVVDSHTTMAVDRHHIVVDSWRMMVVVVEDSRSLMVEEHCMHCRTVVRACHIVYSCCCCWPQHTDY